MWQVYLAMAGFCALMLIVALNLMPLRDWLKLDLGYKATATIVIIPMLFILYHELCSFFGFPPTPTL